MLKLRTFAVLLAVLAVGALVFAKATQSRRDASSANFSYSVDDNEIGGRQIYVDIVIGPTWPTSDKKYIEYYGYACTIDACYPGWCYCDWPFEIQFSGSGEFPAEALEIAPQGQARLMLDMAQVSEPPGRGECETIAVEWTPSGEIHSSQKGQFRVETPTSVEHGVSREDWWHSTAAGDVCGIAVQPPASGYVQRVTLLNVFRELK
jgi:hypothetical protein